MEEKYDPRSIEGKWQAVWEEQKTFQAKEDKSKPKFYCLCMFPYPSGAVHMGHVRNYSIGDIVSRYKRMKGFNVLQPMGWDAFGLPAENAANERGVHPRDWTLQNIAQMKNQFKILGVAYDWEREITTCLPEYYRWEQKLFREFYEKGLAYKQVGFLNWCAKCETVLANEQVHDGKCWRCDGPVTLKEMSQWYLKITAYADQLLKDHEQLRGKWQDRILEMQKHWIGESKGARIQFPLQGRAEKIEVFTTRPDTLFGVTFVSIAAAHPLAESLCVEKGAKEKCTKMKLELRAKTVEEPKKEGFFTGSYALHPVTQEKVPIWVANFVVMEYGTGAVMAVPAHDERDFEFATEYKLPIRQVIEDASGAELKQAYTGPGKLLNSGEYTGLDNEKAKEQIGQALKKKGLGEPTIQYRLRDWGISRQRYWGAPVPVVYCGKCGTVLVPEKDLPVELPYDVKFTGRGGNPLDHHEGFINTKCPKCNGPAKRETDTMDTFVESSWYYARFLSPKYDKGPFEKDKAEFWLPVDFYIGGPEHACMHLLYARFFHKVLRDWGYLKGDEPFARLMNQGMVIKDGAKMSKSKGNVVSPVAIVDKFGADTARLFSLFAAPPEKDLDWSDKGVEGCHRFLHRVWRLYHQHHAMLSKKPQDEKSLTFSDALMAIRKKTHWMIAKVTDNIESEKFNTAISANMELVNDIYGLLDKDAKAFESPAGHFVLYEAIANLVLCMGPYAPHVCEELWHEMGNRTLVANAPWPTYRPEFLVEENFTLVIQVNGKLRERIEVAKTISKEEVQKLVVNLPKIQGHLEGKTIKQVIYVPEKLANIVVA